MIQNIFDSIVIGSGPAGMTAAMYLCRSNYKVALISGEEMFGNLGKISTIQNYPGIDSISGYDLALKMYNQLNTFSSLTKYEFINALEYNKIENNLIEVLLSDDSKIYGKSVIICIGGKHKVMNLKNEQKYFGKGISFCATCDGPMYKNKNVVIFGGGNSALDFALSLSNYCKSITIIHRRDTLRADKTMINKINSLPNIHLKLNYSVKSLSEQNNKLIGCIIKDNILNIEELIKCDGIFYAIGFQKNYLKTNIKLYIPNVFFAGDCIDQKYRQVIYAAGSGCQQALNCINFLKN